MLKTYPVGTYVSMRMMDGSMLFAKCGTEPNVFEKVKMLIPTENGKVAFVDFAPNIKETGCVLNEDHILCIGEAAEPMLSHYREIVSGLALPKQSSIITN